jgi:hypothetical protein
LSSMQYFRSHIFSNIFFGTVSFHSLFHFLRRFCLPICMLNSLASYLQSNVFIATFSVMSSQVSSVSVTLFAMSFRAVFSFYCHFSSFFLFNIFLRQCFPSYFCQLSCRIFYIFLF